MCRSANRTQLSTGGRFEQRIGPLIDVPAGQAAALQKLVSEALDVLRGTGYRLDPQLTLAVKAIAQAEEITATLVPEAGTSEFAQLGGAALEELAPDALTPDAVGGAARRQALRAAGGVIDELPSARAAAARWLRQLEKGEIPVGVRLSDFTDPESRFEQVARLIAAAIVVTGLVIGSAIAASLDPRGSGLRTDLSNVALLLYVVAAAVAVLLVAALLWRIVRPERGRDGRRRS